MVSGLRLRIYNSWLPMHKVKILLLIRKRGAKNTKFGAYIQRIIKSAPEFWNDFFRVINMCYT